MDNRLNECNQFRTKYANACNEIQRIAGDIQAEARANGEISDGVNLTVEAAESLNKKIIAEKDRVFKETFSADVQAIERLTQSDDWKVLEAYLSGMSFALPQNATAIETLALIKAKEDAHRLILELPQLIINGYNENIGAQ